MQEDHLDPLLAQIQSRVRWHRTLLGSLASRRWRTRWCAAWTNRRRWCSAHPISCWTVADLVALEPGPDGLRVQRRTCCLAFTLPEARVCSSCCVPAATGRSG